MENERKYIYIYILITYLNVCIYVAWSVNVCKWNNNISNIFPSDPHSVIEFLAQPPSLYLDVVFIFLYLALYRFTFCMPISFYLSANLFLVYSHVYKYIFFLSIFLLEEVVNTKFGMPRKKRPNKTRCLSIQSPSSRFSKLNQLIN